VRAAGALGRRQLSVHSQHPAGRSRQWQFRPRRRQSGGNPAAFGAIGHGGAERMIVYPTWWQVQV